MSLLYTPYKIFHYPDKLHSLTPDTPITAPVHIRIKPTNICNHNCYYCAYRKEGMQLGQDMRIQDYIAKDKMLEICDDIVEMGVKAVTFTGGGDPLMYPYLLEAAQLLHKGGVKLAMLTNGARLYGDVAEFFAHHAVWVRISMDGWNNASYIEYRGVKDGEYTKILQNMQDFKGHAGSCMLSVSVNIDAQNYTHLQSLTHDIKHTGADSVKFAGCITDNSAQKVNAYHAPFYDTCKKEIDRVMTQYQDSMFAIYDSYHLMHDRFEKDYTWCPYLQILMVIGADANVYPCQDKAYNLTEGLVGSLHNMRFKDFWFSHKDKFYTINPTKVCNHHCVANNKNKMLLEYLDVDAGHVEFV